MLNLYGHGRMGILLGFAFVSVGLISFPVMADQGKRTVRPRAKKQLTPAKPSRTRTDSSPPLLSLKLVLDDFNAKDDREMIQFKARLSREVEKEMAVWKPTRENDQTPKATLLHTDTVLEGLWSYSTRFDSGSFDIRAAKDGTFTVHFESGGCEGHWELKRTGRYEKGVLTLNRPVKTYGRQVSKRLYTVRVGTIDYLLADFGVDKFEKELSADGLTFKDRNDINTSGYAYKRTTR